MDYQKAQKMMQLRAAAQKASLDIEQMRVSAKGENYEVTVDGNGNMWQIVSISDAIDFEEICFLQRCAVQEAKKIASEKMQGVMGEMKLDI